MARVVGRYREPVTWRRRRWRCHAYGDGRARDRNSAFASEDRVREVIRLTGKQAPDRASATQRPFPLRNEQPLLKPTARRSAYNWVDENGPTGGPLDQKAMIHVRPA